MSGSLLRFGRMAEVLINRKSIETILAICFQATSGAPMMPHLWPGLPNGVINPTVSPARISFTFEPLVIAWRKPTSNDSLSLICQIAPINPESVCPPAELLLIEEFGDWAHDPLRWSFDN